MTGLFGEIEGGKAALKDTFDIDAAARRTPDGMAHWATTGPAGTTCRQCLLWSANGYYSSGRGLKPGHCTKYTNLMRRKGGKIPHTTPSCKYFDRNTTPPTAQPPVSNG